MPPEEAGYTYAVEPAATNRLLANEEESIYGHSQFTPLPLLPAQCRPSVDIKPQLRTPWFSRCN